MTVYPIENPAQNDSLARGMYPSLDKPAVQLYLWVALTKRC